MIVSIVPVSAFPRTAVALRIDNGFVSLGEGASFQYSLLDTGSGVVSPPARCALTSGQYADWVGDDGFVCSGIAINLGLTPTGQTY